MRAGKTHQASRASRWRVAGDADEDSPFNTAAGLGFAGLPEAAAPGEAETEFARYGAPVQVELAAILVKQP